MTRKDFILIADVINSCRMSSPDPRMDDLAKRMSSSLYRTNDRFDALKFLKRAGCRLNDPSARSEA